ncbi:MAG: hypothetical protein U0231_08930 [Nitrospiraceae bacterium]
MNLAQAWSPPSMPPCQLIRETRTEREQAYIAGWVARSGALLDALDWLSGVMNGIAALVLVNALAMVRERTREYGVMKTLGFQPRDGGARPWGVAAGALGGALAGLGLLYLAAPALCGHGRRWKNGRRL